MAAARVTLSLRTAKQDAVGSWTGVERSLNGLRLQPHLRKVRRRGLGSSDFVPAPGGWAGAILAWHYRRGYSHFLEVTRALWSR